MMAPILYALITGGQYTNVIIHPDYNAQRNQLMDSLGLYLYAEKKKKNHHEGSKWFSRSERCQHTMEMSYEWHYGCCTLHFQTLPMFPKSATICVLIYHQIPWLQWGTSLNYNMGWLPQAWRKPGWLIDILFPRNVHTYTSIVHTDKKSFICIQTYMYHLAATRETTSSLSKLVAFRLVSTWLGHKLII